MENQDLWFVVDDGFIIVSSSYCDPGYYLVELFDLGGALIISERILHQGGTMHQKVYSTNGKKGIVIGRVTTPIGMQYANKVSF